MDNYRSYLLARVWIFKSSGQDFCPVLFILWVHMSIPEMETLMVAPLVMVTLMMPPFPSTLAWFVDLILVKLIHPSQLLLLLPHSWGVDSSGVGMFSVFSWSGSSLAVHK